MKKQDDMIKQLFDDYARELTPRDDLSSAARDEMTAFRKQQKPSASARKNDGFARHLGWIIPVSLVVLFVSVVSIFLPFLMFNDRPGSGNDVVTTPPAPEYYTFGDVKGRSIAIGDCDGVLQISRLLDEYEIISARYYAFYTEDGELRYIKALLGVRNADGEFTEIEIIAEVDGYVREDLKRVYRAYSGYDRLVCTSDYADDGEYVTQAFFAARDMHFYVVARNGQVTSVAKEIISKLL